MTSSYTLKLQCKGPLRRLAPVGPRTGGTDTLTRHLLLIRARAACNPQDMSCRRAPSRRARLVITVPSLAIKFRRQPHTFKNKATIKGFAIVHSSYSTHLQFTIGPPFEPKHVPYMYVPILAKPCKAVQDFGLSSMAQQPYFANSAPRFLYTCASLSPSMQTGISPRQMKAKIANSRRHEIIEGFQTG